MSNALNDIERIATEAWEEHKTFLDKLYDIATKGEWRGEPPKTFWRIWTKENGVLTRKNCHICHADNKWVLEGDTDEKFMAFVCEHPPIIAGRFGCRVLSSVPKRLVVLSEVAWEPPE